ncbi:uncharacterized protein LOC107473413 [Arachis duranensis]|uniref:ATP-dependent DNA helicase n=1 Tax=Arachis duranensis TaxID=130453 RepID=A0A6P4CBK3_ARADU|nr:uncharacterized protein LOC107473413 [Arachis duranensis]
MWMHERLAKGGANNTILFAICCMSGKVTLPLLLVSPPLLWVLLNGDDQRALHYQKHIRAFNENEVQNRIDAIGLFNQHQAIDHTIVADLISMLDSHNSLAKCFRYARQRFTEDSTTPLQLRLIKKRNTDGRRYNLPSASEVAALIVGDFDIDSLSRDVVIQTHSNLLKRIDVNHPQYLALHNLGFQHSVHEIKSITLVEIEKLLQPNGRSLKEFTDMPFPDYAGLPEPFDTVFSDELNFDRTELASISVDLVSRLNRDQRIAFNTIANAVRRDAGGFFFVCGYGGTGKTFLWNALSASIRSKGDIVLNIASSGIAALLLPNGRTAHSHFNVPLSVNQDSISLDKCLKDVLRFDRGYNPHAPFGGKIVVLGGDFRQILPVIPRGSREEIVHSCINASNLWQSCQVLQLTENMMLSRGSRDIHGVQLKEFATWLLQIGDGLIGDSTDRESVIRIPDNLLLNIESPSWIILRVGVTLDVVTEVNNHVMSLIPGNERVYLSSDTLINEDGHLQSELYTMSTESLNALNCSGPNTGRNTGEVVFIPRMNMSPNNDTLPIRFTRRQFPVALCFAMTINKSQGQTLLTVGVYLPRPVFTHGQLYVVLSRVSMHSGLKILSVDSNGKVSDHTVNVVYREVFTGLLPNILP